MWQIAFFSSCTSCRAWLKVRPDDSIFRSINRMRLIAYDYVAHATSHAILLEYSKRMLHLKASRLHWESREIFHLKGCFVIRFLKFKNERTLNYTKNYKKTRSFGNMTIKIILNTYRDEIPSKNINLKSFCAELFCLGKSLVFFYSSSRVFR